MDEPPRKANLGDAMILIVAPAVGLALSIRPITDISEWYAMIPPSSRSNVWGWLIGFVRKNSSEFLVIQGVIQVLFCLIAPLTPALLAVRLRRPRPPRLVCQPGFASSVALCVCAIALIELSIFDLVTLPPMLAMTSPGMAVLAAWSILAFTGRWKPEASWIDRAGRFVGVFWLFTIPWAIWVSG